MHPRRASVALLVASCAHPQPRAPATTAAPIVVTPATALCATTASALVTAAHTAASQRDWGAWRGLLSVAQAARVPVTADLYTEQLVLGAWTNDLTGVDPASTTIENDGVSTWVMVATRGDREALMMVATEDGCLRIDEN